MDNVTVFPPVNSIRMVPLDVPTSLNYHNTHLDNNLYNLSFKPKERQVDYLQKVQHNQNQHLAFLSNGTATVKTYKRLSVSNGIEELEEIETLLDPFTSSYNMLYQAENGTEYDLMAHVRYCGFGAVKYPEGVYRVHVAVSYDDETTEEFISEPMWVRTKHKNTIVIRYSHNEDDFNVLFKTLNIHFQRRFDSDFMKLSTGSDSVNYNDQDGNVRRLYDKSKRIWKLNIGGSRGVPEWEEDGLSRLLCCSVVNVDNKRYNKAENGKIEKTDFRNYPLQVLHVDLVEYFEGSAGAFINNVPAQLFDNGSFPYCINEWELTDTKTGYKITGSRFEFIDANTTTAKNEQYYTDFYNNNVVPFHKLQGEFIWDNGLTYENGDGEHFVCTKKADTLTIYTGLEATVTDVTYPLVYDMSGLGFHLTVWGDGDITEHTEPGNNRFGVPIVQQVSHTYAATGGYVVRVYTTDKTTVLGFNPQTNKITDYEPGSSCSAKLQRFYIAGHDINDDFDLSFLARAKDELRVLNLSGSAIHSIVAGFASSLVSGSYKPWKFLRYIYLDHNVFIDTAIDAFINELVASSDITSGYGVIIMNYQNPITAPTSASATARATLTAKGYSQAY